MSLSKRHSPPPSTRDLKFCEGAALVRLQALLHRCAELTQQRNEVFHEIVAIDDTGEPLIGLTKWSSLPRYQSLDILSEGLTTLANTLNHERLQGFIALALEQRKLKS
jgi:hypothetical protein